MTGDEQRIPPAWYPDPDDEGRSLRWWDGTDWTERTRSPDPRPPVRPRPDPAQGFPAEDSTGRDVTSRLGTRLRERPVQFALGGLTLIVIFFALIRLAGGNGGGSETETASGTLAITNGAITNNEPCVGVNRYQDIREGSPVVIYDAAGTVLGSGQLGPGHYEARSNYCVFPINVPLSGSSSNYQVQISDRDRLVVQSVRALSLMVGGG